MLYYIHSGSTIVETKMILQVNIIFLYFTCCILSFVQSIFYLLHTVCKIVRLSHFTDNIILCKLKSHNIGLLSCTRISVDFFKLEILKKKKKEKRKNSACVARSKIYSHVTFIKLKITFANLFPTTWACSSHRKLYRRWKRRNLARKEFNSKSECTLLFERRRE